MIVFAARVRLVQRGQVREHFAPRFRLRFGVIDPRQRLTVLMIERNVCEILAPLAVHLIGEARMIRIQFGAIRQDLIGESIQIANASREPRHASAVQSRITGNDAEIAAHLLQPGNRLVQFFAFAVAFDEKLVAGHTIRRTRLDVQQVDVELLQDAQRARQSAAGVVVDQRKRQAGSRV